jgi:hypothetical protein
VRRSRFPNITLVSITSRPTDWRTAGRTPPRQCYRPDRDHSAYRQDA